MKSNPSLIIAATLTVGELASLPDYLQGMN